MPPTVSRGFSDEYGSWNTIWIRRWSARDRRLGSRRAVEPDLAAVGRLQSRPGPGRAWTCPTRTRRPGPAPRRGRSPGRPRRPRAAGAPRAAAGRPAATPTGNVDRRSGARQQRARSAAMVPAGADGLAGAAVTGWPYRPPLPPGSAPSAGRRWPGRRAAAAAAWAVTWQSSSANAQRGWNRQPAGGEIRLGGDPGIGTSDSRTFSKSGPTGPGRACRGAAGRAAPRGRRRSRPAARRTSPRRCWQTWATTGRSWVTNTRLTPDSRHSRASSRRIWSWIVTSSAVVGSSHKMISGSQDSAIAIITRCRMPPENSCG